MLTKEKRTILLFALFTVAGMITTPSVFASTSSDLFIVSSDSGAEVKTMKLKAVKENGEVRRVSGFAITTDNIVSVERDGKVTVFSAPTSPEFTSAKITDTNDNTVDIPITDKGVISLAGYSEGIYTLDVIVDDRFAYECLVVIGPEEVTEETINKEITIVNKRTDHDKIFRPISKERVCLFTPSHPICKPDPNTGKCPPRWSMNEDEQCFPHYLKCPPGYWRADDDETGACVPLPRIPFVPINLTQSDSDRDNETIIPEPPIECPEGEQLSSDGLSCVPIVPEEPIECPEGEQLTPDGLGCETIVAEEPIPAECGEGEELIDGQCQAIPTEEIPTEEIPTEEETTPEGEEPEEAGEEEAGADEEASE